jgi:hypothetical protein
MAAKAEGEKIEVYGQSLDFLTLQPRAALSPVRRSEASLGGTS